VNKEDFARRAFDVMFFSGAAGALAPVCRGLGGVIRLSHVRPGSAPRPAFDPNRARVITPGFLDAAIAHLRQRGFDLLSLRDALQRLRRPGEPRRPFIVFTVEGAYRDSLVHAWPVFRKNNCPFTLFVSTALADGTGELWWLGLEAVIAGETRISLDFAGIPGEMPAVSDAQKQAVWRRLYGPLRAMQPSRQRTVMHRLCREHGIDLISLSRADAMSWHEIRTVARDPLCTIGAGSVHYFALATLSAGDAEAEISESARRIACEVGATPRYFAYPYGDRSAAGPREFALAAKAGFSAAVTGRHGMIFPEHRDCLLALPGISLHGDYQELRYLDVLLSGIPSMLTNGFRKLRSTVRARTGGAMDAGRWPPPTAEPSSE
jgi:peptidoglycan/xylan/chitin deacetylase (PgdA/CDA1 family)